MNKGGWDLTVLCQWIHHQYLHFPLTKQRREENYSYKNCQWHYVKRLYLVKDFQIILSLFLSFFLMCVLKNSNAYDKVKGTFHGKEIIFYWKMHVKVFSVCTYCILYQKNKLPVHWKILWKRKILIISINIGIRLKSLLHDIIIFLFNVYTVI